MKRGLGMPVRTLTTNGTNVILDLGEGEGGNVARERKEKRCEELGIQMISTHTAEHDGKEQSWPENQHQTQDEKSPLMTRKLMKN